MLIMQQCLLRSALLAQILLPIGVLGFLGYKWYWRYYRPRQRLREEKHVRSGTQAGDIRDLNV